MVAVVVGKRGLILASCGAYLSLIFGASVLDRWGTGFKSPQRSKNGLGVFEARQRTPMLVISNCRCSVAEQGPGMQPA